MTAAKLGEKMCVERCVSGISLAREAELKRTLAGYPVETSVKGVGPPRWRSRGLGCEVIHANYWCITSAWMQDKYKVI